MSTINTIDHELSTFNTIEMDQEPTFFDLGKRWIVIQNEKNEQIFFKRCSVEDIRVLAQCDGYMLDCVITMLSGTEHHIKITCPKSMINELTFQECQKYIQNVYHEFVKLLKDNCDGTIIIPEPLPEEPEVQDTPITIKEVNSTYDNEDWFNYHSTDACCHILISLSSSVQINSTLPQKSTTCWPYDIHTAGEAMPIKCLPSDNRPTVLCNGEDISELCLIGRLNKSGATAPNGQIYSASDFKHIDIVLSTQPTEHENYYPNPFIHEYNIEIHFPAEYFVEYDLSHNTNSTTNKFPSEELIIKHTIGGFRAETPQEPEPETPQEPEPEDPNLPKENVDTINKSLNIETFWTSIDGAGRNGGVWNIKETGLSIGIELPVTGILLHNVYPMLTSSSPRPEFKLIGNFNKLQDIKPTVKCNGTNISTYIAAWHFYDSSKNIIGYTAELIDLRYAGFAFSFHSGYAPSVVKKTGILTFEITFPSGCFCKAYKNSDGTINIYPNLINDDITIQFEANGVY